MKKTNAVVLGRLLPDSGKIHQNQEVYSAGGGEREPKVVVANMKIVCERRMDEDLRTFKDGVVGTIRAIDAGGTKE